MNYPSAVEVDNFKAINITSMMFAVPKQTLLIVYQLDLNIPKTSLRANTSLLVDEMADEIVKDVFIQYKVDNTCARKILIDILLNV